MLSENKNLIFFSILFSILAIPDGVFVFFEINDERGELVKHILELPVFFILFISVIRQRKIHYPYFLIFFVIPFRLMYVVSDFINDVDFLKDFIRIIIVSFLFLFIQKLYYEKKFVYFIKSAYFVLSLFIYLNFISILLFPSGFFNPGGFDLIFFLGFKTSFSYYFIFWYLITFILRALNNKIINFSFNDKIISIILVLSSYMAHASVCLVISVFLSITIFFYKKKFLCFLCFASIHVCFLFTFLLSIFLYRYHDLLGPIVNILFSKDASFSSRTVIWNIAFEYIEKKCIIGNGNIIFPIYNWSFVVNQAHNKIIDLLYVGGVSILILFYMLIVKLNNCFKGLSFSIVFFINSVAISYSILFLFEGVRFSILEYFSLALIYYSSLIFHDNGKSFAEVLCVRNH